MHLVSHVNFRATYLFLNNDKFEEQYFQDAIRNNFLKKLTEHI